MRGCVFLRAPLVPRLFRPRCAVWVCVLSPGLGCAPPFLVGLSGCDLVFFFFCVSCFGFVVSVAGCPCPRPCGPCPPIPFLSGWVAGSFFFSRGVCLRVLRVPFFRGPPFLAWCCRFWPGGPPVPLWGSCLRCLLSGGFGRLLWCFAGGLVAVGRFLAPPPPPLFFFGGGWSACSSLCLPWAGACTGPLSVWSSGLPLADAFCLAASRPHGSAGLCTRWARRPFLPDQVLALPAGRLRQAASCGSGLGGLGCPCPFFSAVPVLTF